MFRDRSWHRMAGLRLLGVWLAYLALAVAATWPLAARARDHVFGLGTPPLNIWALGWVLHQLPARPLHLFDGNVFHPYDDSLAFSEHLFVPALQAWPVVWLTGNLVLAHNVVLLVTLATAGLAMFLLAREITGVPAASFAAGVLYAFHTWNINEIIRLQIVSNQWFPLFLLALLKIFDGAGRRFALWAGLFYLLQSLSCMYWALYAPLLAIPVLIYLQWRQPLPWREWKPLLAGLAGAAAVTALFFVPYARTARELGFERAPPMSVRLDRHLDVLPGNWLYAGRLGTARVNQDAAHFLGLTAMGLAVLGASAPRASWPRLAVWKPPLLMLVLGGTLLSLGPEIEVGGFHLGPGPYALLRRFMPGFGNVRYPERFALFTVLGLAPLVAAGLARLRPRVGPVVTVALGLVVFLEHLSVPLELEPLPAGKQIPSVYRWLAAQPDVRVVAEVPASPYRGDRFDALPMYLSTVHWKRTVQGFTGYYPPTTSYTRWRLFHFPEPETLAFLSRLGVDTIVAGPGAALPPADNAAGWVVAERFSEGHAVLRAHASVSPAFPDPPGEHGLVEVPRDGWVLTASNRGARLATDGNPATAWATDDFARRGDFYRIELPEPREVARVSVATLAPYEFTTRLALIGEAEGAPPFELTFDATTAYDHLFSRLLHRPREARLDLDVEPRRLKAVRLRVRETDPFGMPWKMAEVRLFERSRP